MGDLVLPPVLPRCSLEGPPRDKSPVNRQHARFLRRALWGARGVPRCGLLMSIVLEVLKTLLETDMLPNDGADVPSTTRGSPEMVRRLLSFAQVAEVLGVSTKTVRRRVEAGALPVVVDGGLRRVLEVDLEEYIAAHRRAPVVRSQPASKRSRPRRYESPASSQYTGGRVRRLWEDAEANEP